MEDRFERSDQEILALYVARDEHAIAETQAKYGGRLMALALSITENRQDAEECVNDTYLQVWNLIPPHEPERFFAFLCKITRHTALDVCEKRHAQKRRAVHVELTEEMAECLPAPDNEFDPDRELLAAALNRFVRGLDERTRYMFLRRYFYSDPVGEIARALGVSENAVSSALLRARKKLKKLLLEEDIQI